jgi:hypothetical protein
MVIILIVLGIHVIGPGVPLVSSRPVAVAPTLIHISPAIAIVHPGVVCPTGLAVCAKIIIISVVPIFIVKI